VIRVFIGYDTRETIAYHVLCQSILEHTSEPVSFTPVRFNHIQRPREQQSTDFSFSRFIVPYLCDYDGQAIFMDCDMLCRGDIKELMSFYDSFHSVQVVKHDYVPSTDTKFLGQKQTAYKMKNWSSVMLFNNWRCNQLTSEYVNKASGMDLHQFKWATSIGSLPPEWNYLVGEDQPDVDPKLVHFTLGGPWFDEYKDCEYADEWLDYIKN